MDARSLIEQLLALPNAATQQQFLEAHSSSLNDEVALALKAQADQFLRADIQRSLQTASLLRQVATVADRPEFRALGLLAEANAVSIGLGRYQQGLALYDQAAELYRAQGNVVGQARSQVGKIGSLFNLGRYEEALEIGRWASDILAAQADKRPLATLIMNMAVMYGRLGEIGKSLDLADRALDIYRRLGGDGQPSVGGVQMNRANQLRSLGRFDEAIQASQEAYEILTQLDQHVEAARARQSLALTYFVQGRYNEALRHFDAVRDVFLSDGRQRDAILVELFISDCLLQLRRFTDVIEKCRQVRHAFAELGAWYVVAQAIRNEAIAYAELGRFSEALDSLAEARGIFESEGNRTWVASTDLETAAILLRQDRLADCLTIARACAKVFGQHDQPVEKAHASLIAARAAFALDRREDARDMVAEVLHVGKQRNLPTLTYRCHHLLGMLATAQANLPGALSEYDQAIHDLERLRGRLMIEFRVGFLEDKMVIYEDVVQACLELDRPQLGLDYAERAKSRALLDLLAMRLDLGIQARDEADRSLVDRLMQLRARRDQLYRRWESDTEVAVRGWTSPIEERQQAQQEVQALEKQITELWHRLLVHNADYARDAALWQVRTEPIQPYLPVGSVLLEYFAIHGQLVAFLATQGQVTCVRLPTRLSQTQHFIQLLWLNLRSVPRSAPDQIRRLDDNARRILRQLYDQLLKPLESALVHARRLIIVPHSTLHYLPFHAMHDGSRYLLQQYEISYLPGGSFLRYCTEARRDGTRRIAVGHSSGGYLPYAVQEAHTIAAQMGGRSLVEEEATLDHIRQAIPDCQIVHLAAHGDFRPDNPLFSGLAFADGWLTTLDIFSLRLRASLVTLSACQTGRNVISGGDELLGLMRAFLSAGAASLALSLWAVEDRSTAQLMALFYRGIAEGREKAAALRQAALCFVEGLVEAEPVVAAGYAHPYFWAPFFLVGEPGAL